MWQFFKVCKHFGCMCPFFCIVENNWCCHICQSNQNPKQPMTAGFSVQLMSELCAGGQIRALSIKIHHSSRGMLPHTTAHFVQNEKRGNYIKSFYCACCARLYKNWRQHIQIRILLDVILKKAFLLNTLMWRCICDVQKWKDSWICGNAPLIPLIVQFFWRQSMGY